MDKYPFHDNAIFEPMPVMIAMSETFALEDDPIDAFNVSLPPLSVENVSHYKEDLIDEEIPTEALRIHMARLEAQKYLKWIEHIKPGAPRVYHVGNLASDREYDKQVELLARLFSRAADHGLVILVQARIPFEPHGMLEYYAYRTSKAIMPFHLRGLQTIIKEFENG